MVVVLEGPPEFILLCRCTKCKSKLQANRTDLKIGRFGPNWGGETPERLPFIVCPTCTNNVLLSWDQVPEYFRTKSDSK